LLLWQNKIFSAKYLLPSKHFETAMNTQIAIVKTFHNFGHKFFKTQPFWRFFIMILSISNGKYLATLTPTVAVKQLHITSLKVFCCCNLSVGVALIV